MQPSFLLDTRWKHEGFDGAREEMIVRAAARKIGTGMDKRTTNSNRPGKAKKAAYSLDEQVGFILRQVSQRHTTIFARQIGADLTPTQWAALSKLAETGPCSQNQLGRLTAMDVATIKGVIDRLSLRGLTETCPDPDDARRLLVSLTRRGEQFVEKLTSNALGVTHETLAPLKTKERITLLELLKKLR